MSDKERLDMYLSKPDEYLVTYVTEHISAVYLRSQNDRRIDICDTSRDTDGRE